LEASGALTITLHASVSPSEDPAKVLGAARNVLPDCAYEVDEVQGGFTLRSNERACLVKIRDQLRDRHVRAAANRLLLRMRDGGRLTVLLNRQAAAAGVVALCTAATESPLGPLVLQVECDNPDAIIEWLTAY
jgi:predicted RNA binding protein with dsRBD fold (UPF0201 family)